MFALYAWLCQWFYILLVIDLCTDASVGYDSAKRACTGLPFGEIWDLGARGGYWFWLFLLGLPALPVLALHRVVRYGCRASAAGRLTSRLSGPRLAMLASTAERGRSA
jgi:hypothetical protein